MAENGQKWPVVAGDGQKWPGMSYDLFPDGLYAKDLKRGALALRDFLKINQQISRILEGIRMSNYRNEICFRLFLNTYRESMLILLGNL